MTAADRQLDDHHAAIVARRRTARLATMAEAQRQADARNAERAAAGATR